MKVSFWVPKVPNGLLPNLLGLLGLVGIAYFAGSLLEDFRWSGLLGAVFLFVLGWANSRQAEAAETADDAVGEGSEALTGPTQNVRQIKSKAAKSA